LNHIVCQLLKIQYLQCSADIVFITTLIVGTWEHSIFMSIVMHQHFHLNIFYWKTVHWILLCTLKWSPGDYLPRNSYKVMHMVEKLGQGTCILSEPLTVIRFLLLLVLVNIIIEIQFYFCVFIQISGFIRFS